MSVDPSPAYRPIAYVVEAVPEPSTGAFLTLGALGAILFVRQRRRA